MALNRKTFKKAAAVADTNLPSGYFNTVLYEGNGSTQRIGGYINRGAVFNGSSSGINTPIPFLNAKVTSSVSLWVRYTDTAAYKTLFQDWSSNNNWNHNIIVNQPSTGNVRFFSAYGGSSGYEIIESSGLTLNDGNWHNIVSTVDLSTNTLTGYVDGVSVGNVTVSTNSWTGVTQNANIGNENGTSNFFNGSIDQVRIFDKALSSSEVTTLYGETHASTTKSTTDIFNDNSGVALYQLDGNANDTGGVSGYIGEGAIFNGSSSYIDLGSTVDDPLRTAGEFGVSLWFNADSYGTNPVIFKLLNDTYVYIFLNGSNQLECRVVDSSDTSRVVTTSVSLNTWYHVVWTGDSTNGVTLYLNGSSVGNTSWNGTFLTYTNSNYKFNYLGYNGSNTGWYTGKIDQVRIYSKALSSSEASTLYGETASSNITISDLAAYYPMEGTSLDQEGSYHGTDTNVKYNYNGTASNVTYQEATNFSPDLIWIKSRNHANNHFLYDSVRGVNKAIYIQAEPEITRSGVTSFDSNGFTLGSSNDMNLNGSTFVSWCFNAGTDAAASNTDGSITSTVKANQDAGFSIVKYTSNGSYTSSDTIGHGLSQKPELVIWKPYETTASDWYVQYEHVDGSVDYLLLNESDSKRDSASTYLFQDNVLVNYAGANGQDTIAYCFHSVDGIQKVGSYTGTGASGNMIETGFEPAFLLIKQTNTSGSNWNIIDNKRDTANPRDVVLWADSSSSESTASVGGVYDVNFLSNGFSLENTYQPFNASGGTYIYLAIAADPDTTTPTVEDSFEVVTYTGNGSTQDIDTGFKPDLIWAKVRDGSTSHVLFDSVRGRNSVIYSNLTAQEVIPTGTTDLLSFDSNGFTVGPDAQANINTNGNDLVAWCWKAGDHDDNLPQINTEGTIDSTVSVNDAAGFSIVKWTGSAANATVGHGLSAAPEFIITKNTNDSAENWNCWHTGLSGNGYRIILNSAAAEDGTSPTVWNSNINPTSTTFSLGSAAAANGSGDNIIAYCFTSITGYQKIGYFNQVSGTTTVSTGFEPRFLIIKRTDNTGNWIIFDSLRNDGDKALYANTSDDEEDTSGYTMAFNSDGFVLTVAAGSYDVDYIYLAIA